MAADRLQSTLEELSRVANEAGFLNGRFMGHAFQYVEQVRALQLMAHGRGSERLNTICEIGFNAGQLDV